MYLEIALTVCFFAVLSAVVLFNRVRKRSSGNKKMIKISKSIHAGALAYLNAQYKALVVFIIAVGVILYLLLSPVSSVLFVLGAVCSIIAGNIGMRVATSSNAKTTAACEESVEKGLSVAFSAGSVMGLLVVCIGIVSVSVLFYILGDPNMLFSFGFGASSVALFARVGGGIYTKAADVGADMVGKVERRIPEDDPRNPAVIADNVGDTVGDIAGMGADLFESYVESIIAAMAVAFVLFGMGPLVQFPILLASVGVAASIVGILYVLIGKGDIGSLLNRGIFIATGIVVIVSYFIIVSMNLQIEILYCITAGLVAGVVIGLSTEYYTSGGKGPVKRVAEDSQTGAATNIISGLSVGMLSTVIPVLAVAATIIISFYFMGLYGIAIAAVGMLSTLGIVLTTDSYGPISDNAAGIAQMSGAGKKVRENAEKLDAVGNTTAAINKGFAIGSAALTSLVLFSVYNKAVGLTSINIASPQVIAGLFLGGMLPFFFSSLTMKSVGRAATEMVREVRRQFDSIPGILKGKTDPDYKRCIEISTKSALREMVKPALLAILAPLAVGFFLGTEALGGLLAGAIVTGFLLALFMSNAGAAWDNSKKFVESGNFGGKGSDTHASTVVGDTVGDPMKDCSGPSLNILIKLMSIISIVFVPLLI